MDSRRMCPHCRAFINTSDRVCPYCHEAVAPRRPESSGSDTPMLGGFIPQARFNTIVILLINTGLYVATAIYSMNSGQGSFGTIDGQTLLMFGGKYGPAIVQYHQWWRLVTAGFLHGGLLHILMNSWVLFDLGAQVEELYGSSRMLVIYFVANVVGFYFSYWWRPESLSAGASAALFGMVGAMLAITTRYRSALADSLRKVYLRYLVYLLLFSLLPQVDMAAHIGGLAGGFGVAYIAGQPRYQGSMEEKLWRVAGWLSVLVTAFCFLKWYLWFSSAAQ